MKLSKSVGTRRRRDYFSRRVYLRINKRRASPKTELIKYSILLRGTTILASLAVPFFFFRPFFSGGRRR